ncbi:hypothetical protein DSO57_1032522 [Entomophthora muscae]|uniref:Uncharacterized protein n=1 Tax=Entomophthora muscae TaxID=34485 RepID=A0ACC2SPC2_9FUNG|nr:hypothetical protein DSO57_1032522 [Entomophthora muscae]
MLNTLTPVWLEPKLASEFKDCRLGIPLEAISFDVIKSDHLTLTQSMDLMSLTRKIFTSPTNFQLPANFTTSIRCDKPQYTWIRVLAWRMTGQFNQVSKLGKSRIRSHIQSFDTTIPSHLSSGYLDAVVGRIGYCAQNHIKQVQTEIKTIQGYYCKKQTNFK